MKPFAKWFRATTAVLLLLCCVGCGVRAAQPALSSLPTALTARAEEVQPGFTENQTLDGEDGIIHFSYYLPDGYDPEKRYPLIVSMPGYDRMWFGESSAGSNLSWNGVQVWTKLDEPVILVSGQLTDWGTKSARQANELAVYMTEHFAVDKDRIYAAGYSAGGETMSQAVSMRPDLYAAYIHGGSQWDGTYDTVAENHVAVYIFMAENDEYYGSQKARDAYEGLHTAYLQAGLTEDEIDQVLKLNIPDNAYFNRLGIYNYHGGGSVVFDDTAILDWILSQRKTNGKDEQNEKDHSNSSDTGSAGSDGTDGPCGGNRL